MQINDLVKVEGYYGLLRYPVNLVGYVDSFENGYFSEDEAVCVTVLPDFQHLIADNPITVLGDRLQWISKEQYKAKFGI